VLNCTDGIATNRYSTIMASEPFIDDGFEERWAAWQAHGAAHDRATRRKLFVLLAILMLSGAILTGVWWL